ncbi:MAG: alcohol dehydrogenase catalytic domain-containing protein [Planctomycetes bacterium]|nr:alcohol dehydrogenase catalytic domain-containing protein [Planctomycetota bacterium]
MAKMKAAVCHEPFDLTIEEVDKPEPGEGEVVVKVKATGVCGSDVDGYIGKHPWIDLPMILGHECSGVVDTVGPDVTKFEPGDPVVVEPFFVCGECPNCLKGDYNMCRDITIIGHQVDGSFAEYILMTERFLHPLPEAVSFEVGALAEPISGALHGVGRCNLNIGDFVVVLGCGTIGYFLVQHAVNSGAKVLVTEPEDYKREAALAVGAEWVLDPTSESVEDKVMEISDGIGADCVMEAVGIQETIGKTVSLARKGGTILLMGWTGNETDDFDCTNMTLDEMTVLGTMGFAFDFPVTLDLLARDKVDAERIITHRFPLDEAEEALETLHEKRDNVWKAALIFD